MANKAFQSKTSTITKDIAVIKTCKKNVSNPDETYTTEKINRHLQCLDLVMSTKAIDRLLRLVLV